MRSLFHAGRFEVKIAEVSVEEGGLEQLDELLALAAATTDAPSWPASAWVGLLEANGKQSDSAPRGMLLVARAPEGELVGWLAASLLFEVTELESLLVQQQRRGQGIARRMTDRWLGWAAERRAAEARLEVRASNAVALELYRSLRFCEVGRRPGYYAQPREDAVLMVRSVP